MEQLEPEEYFSTDLFVDKSYECRRIEVENIAVDIFALHRSASTDYDLTGQVIWPCSRILAYFLVRHPDLCQGRVLEVGSGAGLAGIVAGKLSKTPHTLVLSDNNDYVLDVLRKNVDHNFADITEKPKCVYLSWGSALAEFKQSHGKFNIILGADVVFWPHAIPLLFQTAAFLLSDEPASCMVIAYITRADKSIKQMFECAEEAGFIWTEIDISEATPPDGVIHKDSHVVIFRRKSCCK